jgi:predicted CXXCH cytochrome family protein
VSTACARLVIPAVIFALGAALGACGGAPTTGPAATGVGVDTAGTLACLACHDEKSEPWSHPSTHRAVLGCPACHTSLGAPGPGHVTIPECADCHSEAAHPADRECVDCHDPHGSSNAFLIRETIETTSHTNADISFTTPEGATANGLARAGVAGQAAGTGLCEVCHDSTRYYPQSGAGEPHDAEYCVDCHAHATRFAAP